MKRALLYPIIFICFFPVLSYSHGGRVETSGKLLGCHQDKKAGNFHCHRKSKYYGKQWKSREEAIKELSQDRNDGADSTSQTITYQRNLFGQWQDEDRNCLNTRHEVLKERSLEPVTLSPNGCTVVSGKWADFYYDEFLFNSSEIDIDHVVPLKHAFDLGASDWSKEKKAEFYNDKENLVITNLKYNRQKGSQTPLTWMPIDRTYACKYMIKWITIKQKYALNISTKESEYFNNLNCGNLQTK